jgi:hypothetical protein
MSNLGFFAADTLGTTIYQVPEGLVGADERTFRLDAWYLKMPLAVQSDLITPREITFWVRIGLLPLYLIVRERECWLFVTTPGTPEAISTPATTITARIAEMRPRIVAVFTWSGDHNSSKQSWRQVALGEVT